MTVLEIIAERSLGMQTLADRPELRDALRRVDGLARSSSPKDGERARISSLVELCSAYAAETDGEEKANILRTLAWISTAEDLANRRRFGRNARVLRSGWACRARKVRCRWSGAADD